MSDELDWNFVDKDDAKADIRAAVEYLLRGTTGGIRGDIVQEILAIVRDAAKARRLRFALSLCRAIPATAGLAMSA